MSQSCLDSNLLRWELDLACEAISVYEDYVRCRREGENDWEASFLLRVGLEYGSQQQRRAAIELAAFSARFREPAEALLSWFSDWFSRLTPNAKDRWWVGMFALSSPNISEELGDARWNEVGSSFGEAVTLELKARVFEPFARTYSGTSDEHWKRVLNGRGTLGDLLRCLLQTQDCNSDPAKALAFWAEDSLASVLDLCKQSAA